jgi:two-component system phosphate regulon response regulator PhoB
MASALARTNSRETPARPRRRPDNEDLAILLVEDEQDLLELLRYNLAREGYNVQTAATGEEALKQVRAEPPNLVLLDLMLPGMDGLEVARTLKSREATRHIPIIMLTAKGEEPDVVQGLEVGADDYITKPFSPRVLMARIRAVLRRGETAGEEAETGRAIRLGGITVDPDRHEVVCGEEPVNLTATEFKLLSLLMSKPGRVFTRQQIIESIHEGFAAVTDRSVDVQVVALRRKLGDKGKNIETVRGVGYRFRE